jgi:carboxymethylenebutenolidase
MKNVTPDPQTMPATWQQHTHAEFVPKDADAALATMTEHPYVLFVATGVVRVGRAAVREYYDKPGASRAAEPEQEQLR